MAKKLMIVAPLISRSPDFEKVTQKFEAVGYSVNQVRLFEQARYHISLEEVLPHAIFLSHAPLSGFDGLEILLQLKASPLFEGIPVILYSSVSDVEVINKAYMLGANHYCIALPPPKDNLDDLIDTLLRFMDLKTLVRCRKQTKAPPISN